MDRWNSGGKNDHALCAGSGVNSGRRGRVATGELAKMGEAKQGVRSQGRACATGWSPRWARSRTAAGVVGWPPAGAPMGLGSHLQHGQVE